MFLDFAYDSKNLEKYVSASFNKGTNGLMKLDQKGAGHDCYDFKGIIQSRKGSG
jgi:hypothetical protein